MTLPPNCLPAEKPAVAGDLATAAAAGLVTPASAEGAGASGSLFACLLDGSTTVATADPTTQAACLAPGMFAGNNPLLYSAFGYGLLSQANPVLPAGQQTVAAQPTALVQQAVASQPTAMLQPPLVKAQAAASADSGDSTPEAPADDADASESSETPATKANHLLAYQLIAGQWVVQPTVTAQLPQPLEEAAPAEGLELPSSINTVSAGLGTAVASASQQSLVSSALLPDGPAQLLSQNQETGIIPKGLSGQSDTTGALAGKVAVSTQKDFAQAVVSLDPMTEGNASAASTPPDTGSSGQVRPEKRQNVRPASTANATTSTTALTTDAAAATTDAGAAATTIPALMTTNTDKSGVVQPETQVKPQHAALADDDSANVATVSSSQPAQAETVAKAAPTVSDFRAQNSLPEKIAAPSPATRAEVASGVNSPRSTEEKKTLTVDTKKVNAAGRNIGTSIANREVPMPYSAANKPSVADQPASVRIAAAEVAQTSSSAVAVDETTTVTSVQAPRLVQEIRNIADRIASIDRNTVEVRFDFSESDRLSVRVEYRDGAVHTTFRTDSNQLREAISQAWQTQSTTPESRGYRMTDPVFTTNSATSSSQDFSSLGNGSGQSRSSYEQQAGSGFAPPARSSSLASSSSAPAAPVSTVRPETSRHLHTFA